MEEEGASKLAFAARCALMLTLMLMLMHPQRAFFAFFSAYFNECEERLQTLGRVS